MKQSLFFFTVLALMLAGLPVSAAPDAALAAGTWSVAGAMNTGRSHHTATLLPDGRVLVAGGFYYDGSDHYLTSAETYNPAVGNWGGSGNNLHAARADHTATLLANGKVLVVGGFNGVEQLASAEIFDPVTGHWSPTGSLHTARANHTATLLPSGKVLVVGGLYSDLTGHYLASAEVYDPASGTWSATGSLNTGRTSHTATLLPDGQVLVAGGYYYDGSNHYLNSVEVYDLVTGTWTDDGILKSGGRADLTATLLPNGHVLVVGGYDGAEHDYFDEYDPASHGTTAMGPLLTARAHHTATLLPNGQVIVVGGGPFAGPLASAERYDPDTGWSATGSLNTGRRDHTATLLPDGRVLVAGGRDSSAYLASAEIYTWAAGVWTAAGTLAAARSNHAAALLPDGRVIVAGGYDGSSDLNSSEIFNPMNGTWSGADTLNFGRRHHTMTLLPNGRVLAVGGYYDDGSIHYLSSAESYNPAGDIWGVLLSGLTTPRTDHTATLLADGRLLVVGGSNAGGTLTSAEIYDLATGTWSTTGSLTTARHSHTATLLLDGRVVVAGGRGSGGTPLASSEVYDPATGTWSTSGDLNAARVFHTASLLYDGRVLVAGGLGSGTTYLDSAEIYNPATGAWYFTGSLGTGRDHHEALLLPDSHVLVVGGYRWDGADHWLTSAEVFNPAVGTWEAVDDLASSRTEFTLTLLPDGRPLAIGGYNGSLVASAEAYKSGLGAAGAWRPTLTTATSPLGQGARLHVSGSGFRGYQYIEGSSGDTKSSPTNYPLVQLRRLDNEQVRWLHPDPATPFSAMAFTSEPTTGFCQGPALVTVFVNGIPSLSKVIQVAGVGYVSHLPLTLKGR